MNNFKYIIILLHKNKRNDKYTLHIVHETVAKPASITSELVGWACRMDIIVPIWHLSASWLAALLEAMFRIVLRPS